MKIIMRKSEMENFVELSQKVMGKIATEIDFPLPFDAENTVKFVEYVNQMEDIDNRFVAVSSTEDEISIHVKEEFVNDVIGFFDEIAAEGITYISKHKLLLKASCKTLKVLLKNSFDALKESVMNIAQPFKESSKELSDAIHAICKKYNKKYDEGDKQIIDCTNDVSANLAGEASA